MASKYLSLVLMFGLLLPCGIPSAAAGDKSPKKDYQLSVLHTRKERLDLDHMSLPTNDGKTKDVPVSLETTEYQVSVDGKREGSTYGITLSSLDPSVPYSWTFWPSEAFGELQLVKGNKNKYYLAWGAPGRLCFADVSVPNDKLQRFHECITTHDWMSGVVQMFLRGLIPSSELDTWGVNAHFDSVRVKSIERDDEGNWKVKVSGPKNEKFYTQVSDPKLPTPVVGMLGWRLQQEDKPNVPK
jgi:hypothetical protein